MKKTPSEKSGLVVYLKHPPTATNSFLRDQVEQLKATPLYLEAPYAEFPNAFGTASWTERLRGQNLSVPYRSLRALAPRAVLAEYGVTAAQIVDACEALKIPLVTHFHGFDASRKSVLERFGEAYKRVFRYSAHVVSVSEPMSAALVKLGCPPEKIFRIPYGVRTTLFQQSTPSRNRERFLFVGRMIEKKGPWFTLLAFARFASKYSNAELRMVGEGPLLDSLKSLAQALGLSHRVQFPGTLSHDAVAAEMREARCYVQHSLRAVDGDSEGMPVAILEASASGLPVVSTRHAGIPEAVEEGVTGFLVPELSIEAMSEAMERFVANPSLADEMGARGRQQVCEHFDQDRQIGRLRELLETAPAKRAA